MKRHTRLELDGSIAAYCMAAAGRVSFQSNARPAQVSFKNTSAYATQRLATLLQKLPQLPAVVHLRRNVTTANEVAVDIQLRERWPARELFQSAP